MYRSLMVAVDNSPYSDYAIQTALVLARGMEACVTGFHAYAARLHDARFRDMEPGLPERYQRPEELARQRDIHNSLIGQGLQVISDSYLDRFERQCLEAGVPCQRRTSEGQNYVEILKELHSNGYDLLALGALGLGAAADSQIGSVCHRAVLKARRDVLVLRGELQAGGRVVVGVDGSPYSFAAVERAVELGRVLHAPVEAVAVYDPYFHTTAFHSIAGVLSEEAGKLFRFRDQERLHGEIINQGLEKIYGGYLEEAQVIARDRGGEVSTVLLTGKPFSRMLRHLRDGAPPLVVVGRFGLHRTDMLDMGSTAENLLRLAPGNVLVVSGQISPSPRVAGEEAAAMPWTSGAEERLLRVPPFARGMARKAIEDYARERGLGEITVEVMVAAREHTGI
jgi:nucleotide-binding universal stress UspA family protein